jgi:hypothetical protein
VAHASPRIVVASVQGLTILHHSIIVKQLWYSSYATTSVFYHQLSRMHVSALPLGAARRRRRRALLWLLRQRRLAVGAQVELESNIPKQFIIF